MICGSSKDKFNNAISLFSKNKLVLTQFISKLSILISQHLFYQILAGCQIVQLFDSHLGLLNGSEECQKIAIDLNCQIASQLKSKLEEYGLNIPIVILLD